MAELLLLNPAKRRRAKKSARTPAQKRATAKLVAMNRRTSNPVAARPARKVYRKRRRNPVSAIARNVRRRRRNPVMSMGGGSSILGMLKGAAVSGAGAVAMDVAIGQVNKFLPASMLGTPGQIDQGDAVKAALTVLLGKLLNKPTRGLSMKAAQASLTVQAYNMVATLVPASMPLGYMSPGRVVQGSMRIGPNVRSGAPQQMGRFVAGGTPLLSRYQGSGASPLLNGATGLQNRMQREGFNFR